MTTEERPKSIYLPSAPELLEEPAIGTPDVVDRLEASVSELRAALEVAEKRAENLRASHDFPRLQDVAELSELRAALGSCTEREAGNFEEVKALRAENLRLAAESKQCHEQNDRLFTERRALRLQKDTAYSERNQVVALLARVALALGWKAGTGLHPAEDSAWEADWRTILFLELPTGQASWHFHESERHLLAGLPEYPGKWDGHSTDAKYERVRTALTPPPDAGSVGQAPACTCPSRLFEGKDLRHRDYCPAFKAAPVCQTCGDTRWVYSKPTGGAYAPCPDCSKPSAGGAP